MSHDIPEITRNLAQVLPTEAVDNRRTLPISHQTSRGFSSEVPQQATLRSLESSVIFFPGYRLRRKRSSYFDTCSGETRATGLEDKE